MIMKQTITFSDFVGAFRDHDRYDQFGYQALEILYNYLEELDPDYELDVIAICCEYSVDHADDIAAQYAIDVTDTAGEPIEDEDERAELVESALNENTSVCGRYGNHFVYQQF
jgi:hypothetical protein